MEYTNADVFVYQIINCLVGNYDYKIVNVATAKKDLWLANPKNEAFPIIRLNAQASTSAMFETEYLTNIQSALNKAIAKEGKVFIINTNETSTPFNEVSFIQMVLTQDTCSDESIYTHFPKLANVLHTVNDNQQECAKLTKQLELIQMAKLRKENRFSFKKLPVVSSSIAFVMAITFLLSSYFVLQHAEHLSVGLVASGAYYKSLVLEANEYWRFITMTFIHSDLITIMFFGFMLVQIGQLCEKEYGKLKYFLIFASAALFGNVFPFIFDSNTLFMGMGAGIFGLLGALIVYIFKKKLYLNKLIALRLSNIYIWVFVCFFMEGISTISLLAGFIWGLFMAVVLFPNNEFKEVSKHFIFGCFALIVSILYGASQIDTALPNPEFDTYLIEQYETLGLDDYAEHIKKALHVGEE